MLILIFNSKNGLTPHPESNQQNTTMIKTCVFRCVQICRHLGDTVIKVAPRATSSYSASLGSA